MRFWIQKISTFCKQQLANTYGLWPEVKDFCRWSWYTTLWLSPSVSYTTVFWASKWVEWTQNPPCAMANRAEQSNVRMKPLVVLFSKYLQRYQKPHLLEASNNGSWSSSPCVVEDFPILGIMYQRLAAGLLQSVVFFKHPGEMHFAVFLRWQSQ